MTTSVPDPEQEVADDPSQQSGAVEGWQDDGEQAAADDVDQPDVLASPDEVTGPSPDI